MRHPDARTDLAAASLSYQEALGQFKEHLESLRQTLDAIVPESQKDRYQKYLDYKHSPGIAFKGESLGLPLAAPAALMAWGADAEEKLNTTHGRTNHLRERVFVTLSDALYALGHTAPEWVAPCANKPYLETVYRIASEYRREHLDGKEILTTDGPFANGLGKRLGIKPEQIFKRDNRTSAFEMAYWAIQDAQQSADAGNALRC